MPNWHDVKISAPGPGGMGATVEIDGMVIRGVLKYKVKVGTTQPTVVTISFIANSVNDTTVPVTAPAVE